MICVIINVYSKSMELFLTMYIYDLTYQVFICKNLGVRIFSCKQAFIKM